MNCATHGDVAAAAYCRTCGKALCNTCARNVQGVIYCEGCLAARLGENPTFGQQAWQQGVGTTASPTKPGLAAFLGFIPGVGAMYNGQFLKGFMHALGFIILIWLADRVGPATIPVFFIYVFYMVFDAYKTAQALERGEAPPDFLGLERVFGPAVTRTHGHVVTAVPPTNPPPAAGVTPMGNVPPQDVYGGALPASPARAWHGLPVGAIVLIIIGCLFLIDNLGFDFPVHRFWPVILIVLGVWLVAKRWNRVS